MGNTKGKSRFVKFYKALTAAEQDALKSDMRQSVLAHDPNNGLVIERAGYKIVFRLYACLFICFAIDESENELEMLLLIHNYVLGLDRFYKNACELDIMNDLQSALTILDEVIFAGQIHEMRTNTAILPANALVKFSNDEIMKQLK